MQDVREIAHNQVLVTALIACFLAQFLKLVVEAVRHQRLNFHVLIETGGMPSSHSSLVAALATGVGQTIGWSSTEFAVATIFAIIVMYDASGVRWAAGQQARILNQIVETGALLPEKPKEGSLEVATEQANQESSEQPNGIQEKDKNQKRLKELLGHTPIEVFVGSILGVAVSLIAGVTAWAIP
jgi:acid phosphatase family membrane protein YuiD